jgi:hypothetical protein
MTQLDIYFIFTGANGGPRSCGDTQLNPHKHQRIFCDAYKCKKHPQKNNPSGDARPPTNKQFQLESYSLVRTIYNNSSGKKYPWAERREEGEKTNAVNSGHFILAASPIDSAYIFYVLSFSIDSKS